MKAPPEAPFVENVRRQWEEGARRLEREAMDPHRQSVLLAQIDAVTEELRRRMGQTYTLGELADTYSRADDWSRDAVAERAATPGWARDVTLVQDAAFHAYARGATDYAP